MITNHKSESDFFSNKSQKMYDNHETEKSLLYFIKLQQGMIDNYKKQLNEANWKISHCRNNLNYIKQTNTFNPNDITDALIHHENDEDEKLVFKNAVTFMQKKLNYVLDNIDKEDE